MAQTRALSPPACRLLAAWTPGRWRLSCQQQLAPLPALQRARMPQHLLSVQSPLSTPLAIRCALGLAQRQGDPVIWEWPGMGTRKRQDTIWVW